jgi:hypothetical protein
LNPFILKSVAAIMHPLAGNNYSDCAPKAAQPLAAITAIALLL